MNPATVLVDEPVRCGLTDAVRALGSRPAPLALALHAAEKKTGGLRLHVRIDERAASFLAPGLASPQSPPTGTPASHTRPRPRQPDPTLREGPT